MMRISIGIGFCSTGATVTGTGAACPPPRPPPGGELVLEASPPEQARVSAVQPRTSETASGRRIKGTDLTILLNRQRLFKAKRFNRVERRRLSRRVKAEEDPGRRREAERHRDRVHRDSRRPPLP